jgi:hypothetical protein
MEKPKELVEDMEAFIKVLDGEHSLADRSKK